MNKLAAYIFTCMILLSSLSCKTDVLYPSCEEVEVMLVLDSEPLRHVGDVTKAAPDNVEDGAGTGYLVEDFWLFEYNSNGLLVGRPRYYENVSSGVNVSVLRPSSGTYKCYIIANTHNPALLAEIGGYKTASDLRQAFQAIDSYADLYQKGSSGSSYDLLMSGVVEVGVDTGTGLVCSLKRNVAKVTLDISNGSDSQITLNTIQWKNVSDHLFYADVMYDGASGPSPTERESGFINLEVEDIELAEGGSKTLTYYLPRNMRGRSGSASQSSDKNLNAPSIATYLEVMATNNNTGTSLRYRFYPGKDMLTSFDLEPNCHYHMPLTFNSKGSEEDSRVEDMGLIHLGDANSYIINPMGSVAQTMYSVPVSGRVNKFWNSSEGRKVGASYADHMIGDDTDWIAEIIWQDVPQKVFLFCDENGREFAGGQFSATGQKLLYFRTTQAAYNNPCNVLIGVRKADSSNYLWSWHIWITDYNPDQNIGGWKDGLFSYPVDGGYLHRYSGTYWSNRLNGKYIMDRNIGARSASRDAGLINNAGMGYQFGRKDPFPMVKNYPFYDKDGNRISFSGTNTDPIGKSDGPAWMYQSVYNPTIFYKDPYPHEDWVKNEDIYRYAWNDIDGKSSGKSFFDPCPPGWKLPEKGTWDYLTLSVMIEDSWSSGPTLGWDLYMGPSGDSETVFFPIAGWRGLDNGTIGYNQSASSTNYIFTRIWNSTPVSTNKTSAYFINLGRGNASVNYAPNVTPNATNYRSYANSVRCIQE